MPLLDYWFELATMSVLVAASAFFSGSEAALFSISRSERSEMAGGGAADRRVSALLSRPERLLTAILFWNLVVNMTYYALTEVVAMRLARTEGAGWTPTIFTVVALVAIILLSEVLPKSLAVLKPRWTSGLVSAPLAGAARLVDPVLPILQTVSDAISRLLLPNLEPEPYMELGDLERAVAVQSGETVENESLLIQERLVLQRLVELADTTAAELMRPRRRCLVVRPPVSLSDLVGRVQGIGEYVLITEPDSDEIARAVAINRLAMTPPDRIDLRAEPMSIVPWCAPASVTLEQLRRENRRVAVVINELGETIGIVPLEQLLDAVLRDASRADPHDAHGARVVQLGPDAWEASGGTPLRRVAKRLGPWIEGDGRIATTPARLVEKLVAARSLTVAGLIQEELQRPLRLGDRVELEGLAWTVVAGAVDDEDDDPLIVRIEPAQPPSDEPSNNGAPSNGASDGAEGGLP